MPVTPGTRIGAYEVVSLIGVGGMGEVYRATDTNLKRQVAIKVLPTSVAADADRLARFQREAEVLAALNHPHIAQIYGLETSGATIALVMELVEGPTLADRIAQGAIPLEDALPIAKQIADALEAAHEQGIVHRDLKPANIKVREDGTVKVLDFGLAKAMDPAGASSDHAMNSPTISMHATQAGMILGTAAYMAPEQARGKTVDKRADIWAFGCVLYEMLTGQGAFGGDDVTVTLARVVEREPDFAALPPSVPARVRQVLQLCLRKDPKQRVGDIRDVRLALEGAFETMAVTPATSAVMAQDARPLKRVLPIAAAIGLAVAIVSVAVTWFAMRPAPPTPPPLMRFAIVPPPAQPLAFIGADRDLAISPDGTALVYRVRAAGGQAQLVVRRLDALETQAVTGLSSAGGFAVRSPFFSPDGHWVGFFDGTELKKVAITGGPAITLCTIIGGSRGASWGDDDTIVFATNAMPGLQRVPAGGGDPTGLTTPDAAQHETGHWFPSVLPGGRGVLFTIMSGSAETAQVAVLDLQTGQRTTLVRGGSQATYVDPSTASTGSGQAGSGQAGYLVYGVAGTLRAVPFDRARLAVVGDPVPVVAHVTMGTTGAAEFVVARSGTLVYVPGGADGQTGSRSLVWVNRQGHEAPIAAPPRAYVTARLSPDGTRVALEIRDQEQDIWTWDLARQTLTRVTFDPGADEAPVWTPDSRRILFASNRAGTSNLFWHAADGTGPDQRLTTSTNAQYPTSVTPDGTHVLGYEFGPKTGADVVQFAWDGAAAARGTGASAASGQAPSVPLVQTPFIERNAAISPDGRYLAYESSESGLTQVYVRPYPTVNAGRWQVSTGGGRMPAWARTGRELFYVDAAGTLTAVPVQTTGATFSAGNPATVFATKYAMPVLQRTYDVSADGLRFLMIKESTTDGTASLPSMTVVLNWFEELKARVPTK